MKKLISMLLMFAVVLTVSCVYADTTGGANWNAPHSGGWKRCHAHDHDLPDNDDLLYEGGVGLDIEYAFNKSFALGLNGRWLAEEWNIFDADRARVETVAEIRLKFGPGNK